MEWKLPLAVVDGMLSGLHLKGIFRSDISHLLIGNIMFTEYISLLILHDGFSHQ